MGIREKMKEEYNKFQKISTKATETRKENPVTKNGGGKVPGKFAEVPGANDPNLERAPKDARFADVGGNTKHERRPRGGEEK